jgi:glycosyltransferase involved in cell wall biosynthesis
MNGIETGRPRVLVFVGSFLPGEKSGGPIQSIAGLLEALGSEFEFRVVTSGHDLGERDPLSGIEVDVWQNRHGGSILYLSRGVSRFRRIVETLRGGEYDLIYLNSFFSGEFSVLPLFLRKLGLGSRVPVILAPRGEFSPGALGIKHRRKATYLVLVRAVGLYAGVWWQASNEREGGEILSVLHADRESKSGDFGTPEVFVATDIPRREARRPFPMRLPKRAGELNLVLVGRIARMKNIDGAIRMLGGLSGTVNLTICGPFEDSRYWKECEEEIGRLPANISVRYVGQVAHEEIGETFARADFLFLPTRGENFGHAIRESLVAGCPVLISDRTMWRNLEAQGGGWDLPLEDEAAFRRILQYCVDMNAERHSRLVASTLAVGRKIAADETAVEEHRRLFREVLSRVRPMP